MSIYLSSSSDTWKVEKRLQQLLLGVHLEINVIDSPLISYKRTGE